MNDQGAPRTDGEQIAAVRFRPTPAVKAERGTWLNRRRAVTLIAVTAAATFLWFIFTAKSVSLEVSPADAAIDIDGGFAFRLGDIHLMREGAYRIRAAAPGYAELSRRVGVGKERNQIIPLAMTPLPGKVTFSIGPPGATVAIAGAPHLTGTAPLLLHVPAGRQAAHVSHPRYDDGAIEFEVEGRELAQTVTLALLPNWADVTVPTTPPGAEVRIDDGLSPIVTPGPIPVLAGEHRLVVALPGYKPWTDILYVEARQAVELPAIVLDRADGAVHIRSSPSGAGVTVAGVYGGVTPLEIGVDADLVHAVSVFKVGYAPSDVTVTVSSGERRAINVSLTALTGDLVVETEPQGAELWIDDRLRGPAAGVFTLPAVPHEVEIRKEGYAGYQTTVMPQPGFPKELKVRLLTLAEARLEALKRVRTTGDGHELVLLGPGSLRMGASRREPGRRANEVLRDVALSRLFYLGRHEVTNAQFRVFATGHSSGQSENMDLELDDQPVVRVSWQDAALYCNWLSDRDGLQPFYQEEFGKIVGFNAAALGYRLPTEAEWAWAARHVDDGDPLRFPWGDQLPPPDRHGNYADASAAHTVGRIIFGYNDNHIASAPVGSFRRNDKGIYDLGGNVAEWVHDFYAIPDAAPAVDPLGPDKGEYHVIRGASWMHGTVTDLRLSSRDYGADGRPDLGIRIARYAE